MLCPIFLIKILHYSVYYSIFSTNDARGRLFKVQDTTNIHGGEARIIKRCRNTKWVEEDMTIDSTDTPENECSEHEVCLGDITCDENFDTFLCRSFFISWK